MQYFSFWVKIKTLGLKFVPQLTLHCLCHRIKTSKSKEDHFSQSHVNPLFRSLKFFFLKNSSFQKLYFFCFDSNISITMIILPTEPGLTPYINLIFTPSYILKLFHMMTWKATKVQKKIKPYCFFLVYCKLSSHRWYF